MMLRTFTYRVPKRKERVMLRFMKVDIPRMLRRIPGCRSAYLARRQGRSGEYIWVSLWANDAAWKKAGKRKEWKELGVKEKKLKFFKSRPRHVHYDITVSV